MERHIFAMGLSSWRGGTLIYTDELFSVTRRLQADAALGDDVRSELAELCRDEAYLSWRDGGLRQAVPFRLPSPLGRSLGKIGLVDNDNLLVNVYAREQVTIVTDTVLIPNEYRVFPFIDESSLLVSHAVVTGLSGPHVLVVDPATGCGNHLLALPKARRRVGYDINPRSLAFSRLNAVLNACLMSWSYNDVTTGLPRPQQEESEESCLVLANMPIGLAPMKGVLPVTSDGGATGSRLTLALLDALSRWRPGMPTTALLLFYSVANPTENRWELPDRAVELFGATCTSWELLESEKLWRVNGRKQEPNPMPVDALPRRADCRFYVEDQDRDAVRVGYLNLVESLKNAGWTHVVYGRMRISLK